MTRQTASRRAAASCRSGGNDAEAIFGDRTTSRQLLCLHGVASMPGIRMSLLTRRDTRQHGCVEPVVPASAIALVVFEIAKPRRAASGQSRDGATGLIIGL
jgi:hypothetical protein